MNKTEREKFIKLLVKNVLNDLVMENKEYPDTWEGYELRCRIKDAFDMVVFMDMSHKRSKDYVDVCLTKNFIGRY